MVNLKIEKGSAFTCELFFVFGGRGFCRGAGEESPMVQIIKNYGKLKIKVKYIELDNLEVTLENIKKSITEKTKVISLSHVTNVIGDIRPIEEICKYAHELGIQVLVDGAQSIAHMKIDVTKLDVDFFCFSAHKMYGPTGVGVIYGK